MLLVFLFSPAWGLVASATDSAALANSQSQRLQKLEQQTADAKSSADNAWMLTSSALALMMTGPGLALFYGGLGGHQNGLLTFLQSFALVGGTFVVFVVCRLYSICRIVSRFVL